MIPITDITSNVATDAGYNVTGDGVFDNLMETVNAHIKAQFDADRIKESDIANMYVGIIPAVLAQSVKLALEAPAAAKNEEVLEAQRLLYDRQREGFDDNKYQKLFETQMNSWGLMFSSGLLTQKPAIISSDKASELYNELTSSITSP